MKSLIYGYGETGKSFERYLRNKNKSYEIFDKYLSKYNKKYNFEDFDEILCSPGIPKKYFKILKHSNKNVYTDIDIFFKEDKSIKIGITGTNRKSTTAFHLAQIFENYEPTNLIGNIGNPMLDFINNDKKYSIIELSSFQLDKMNKNFLDFGVLLNIDIDHLDYHGNSTSYKKTKEKILYAKKHISYETDPYKIFNWITGIQPKKIIFKDLPFRCEKIARNIINDSKSTNYHSLKFALQQTKNLFHGLDYVLITCGDPTKEMFRKIEVNGPETIYIFGNHAESIDKCIRHEKKIICKSLEDILYLLKDNISNTNILFSPGYPSGNDFTDFNQRGKYFNQLVEKVSK